jgi:hypothetical protein
MSDDKEKLPKLNLLQLSIYIGDLLLVSEGSIESVRHRIVRRAWHVFFFSTVIIVIITSVIIGATNSSSVMLTAIIRLFFLVSTIWLILTLTYLISVHYKYMMITGKDLRFHVIAFFFGATIVLFGHLYEDIYFITPSSFNYINPIYVPSAIMSHLDVVTKYLLKFDFIIYAACTSVVLSYPAHCVSIGGCFFLHFSSDYSQCPVCCLTYCDVRK